MKDRRDNSNAAPKREPNALGLGAVVARMCQLMDRLERWLDAIESAPASPVKLTDTEQFILEELGNDTFTAPELLKKMAYPAGSFTHLKTTLSNLRKRGIVKNEGHGYFRPIGTVPRTGPDFAASHDILTTTAQVQGLGGPHPSAGKKKG